MTYVQRLFLSRKFPHRALTLLHLLARGRFIRIFLAVRAHLEKPRSLGKSCNICGHDRFRRHGIGQAEAVCAKCGSRPRHRAARLIWEEIPHSTLSAYDVLQVSADTSVDPKWFRSFEMSLYGRKNSIDLQDIDRPDQSYDAVICNHVLEHVADDRKAFRELMRIVKRKGFLQFSVPSPHARATTEDWGYPRPDVHYHYRTYGRDLIDRFSDGVEGIHIRAVNAADPVTGEARLVYFASMDPHTPA